MARMGIGKTIKSSAVAGVVVVAVLGVTNWALGFVGFENTISNALMGNISTENAIGTGIGILAGGWAVLQAKMRRWF